MKVHNPQRGERDLQLCDWSVFFLSGCEYKDVVVIKPLKHVDEWPDEPEPEATKLHAQFVPGFNFKGIPYYCELAFLVSTKKQSRIVFKPAKYESSRSRPQGTVTTATARNKENNNT